MNRNFCVHSFCLSIQNLGFVWLLCFYVLFFASLMPRPHNKGNWFCSLVKLEKNEISGMVLCLIAPIVFHAMEMGKECLTQWFKQSSFQKQAAPISAINRVDLVRNTLTQKMCLPACLKHSELLFNVRFPNSEMFKRLLFRGQSFSGGNEMRWFLEKYYCYCKWHGLVPNDLWSMSSL